MSIKSKQFISPVIVSSLALLLYYLFSVTTIHFSHFQYTILQVFRNLCLLIFLFLLFEKLAPLQLYTKILITLFLGAVAGILFQHSMLEIKPIGTAFIRLIQMIVVPLVFASLLVGTASLGNVRKLGRIGTKTLIYYLLYTAFAITVGLILANVFKPGSGLSENVQARLMQNFSGQVGSKISNITEHANPLDILLNIIPSNPIEALGQGKLLQIIFFAIFVGITLTLIPKKKAKLVISLFDAINDVMVRMVHIIIAIAPYGVFALIASVVGSFGVDILFSLIKYTLLTITGLIFLYFTYPTVVQLLTPIRWGYFVKGILPAQTVAFSTSSSSATLPVTIEVCQETFGVPNNIASFVLPLGATINMDGTALYQGVSAVFIAQVYGMHLGIVEQLTIVLTATLASIGTAGAPGVGILMLVIVLRQVGIPLEGIALILGVERILDMFRTTINVTSDAAISVVVAASEGELGQN